MALIRLALLAFLVAIVPARAAPTFPALTGRVVDDAGLLDAAARAKLDTELADLEKKTTTQLVVVTLPSLQGYDIADFGYQLGRHWGIGQKGTNNGAILIVAAKEHQVRIEVGYGLEGTLTDAVSRLIIENAILPRFRVGDFAGGIERGTADIVQVLSGDADNFKQRAAERKPSPNGAEGFGTFVVLGFILLIWVIAFMRSSRRGVTGRGGTPWIIPTSFPSGGGGWSGGGGGDDSGFSGGGGSFGGGGASGSW